MDFIYVTEAKAQPEFQKSGMSDKQPIKPNLRKWWLVGRAAQARPSTLFVCREQVRADALVYYVKRALKHACKLPQTEYSQSTTAESRRAVRGAEGSLEAGAGFGKDRCKCREFRGGTAGQEKARGSSSRCHRQGSKREGGARLIHTHRPSDTHQGKGKGHAGPQRKALHDHSPKSTLLLVWHLGLAIHCEWLRLAHHGRLVGDRVPVVGSCSAEEDTAGDVPARGCGWKM